MRDKIKKHPIIVSYVILGLGLFVTMALFWVALGRTNELAQENLNNAIAGCERSNQLRELVEDTNHTLAILVRTSIAPAEGKELPPQQQALVDVFEKQLEILQKPIQQIDCGAAYDNGS